MQMGLEEDCRSILLFAGQGTAAINSPDARQRALRDAEIPSCSVLLSSCYETFLSELSSLPAADLHDIELDLSDFRTKESLLEIKDGRYSHNPVVTGPTLFLVQTLRYLAFAEGTKNSTGSLTQFTDILIPNGKQSVGILGFSSGILPACVVGCSASLVDYITRATGAYRLALWIGIRTQLYRRKVLYSPSQIVDPSLPWSLVFFGLTRQAAEDALTKFNNETKFTPLYVTAVMDESSVTISGHPSALAAFSSTLGPAVVVHQTTVDTLYHAPVHAEGVKKQVLDDVSRRNISFAEFSDIHIPIRSTYTGKLITSAWTTTSLVEVIVDLILAQPVNWNLAVKETLEALPERCHVRIINAGPGVGLARSLERAFSDHPVILSDLMSGGKSRASAKRAQKQEPIAIVGMAVHLPGAMDFSELWQVLEKGINTISEIPDHRFKVSDYNNAKDKSKRTMKAHTGNFIDGVDEFDNQFFRISPREAKSLDPQQRILLHTAYEALEDAGYVPGASPTSRPERFGCYMGVATHDYVHNLRDEIDVYYSTSTLSSFLSGRISYAMQLSGPSIVVDTACSSSLVAIYQGARALSSGDCDAAMVGGVNVISSPDMFIGLDRGHFLSPTGQCKPFDASADGYSRGEGCGTFVLKRLSDAINENDHIWGVIRGIEVNHSGLAHSITHPHAPTQARLFGELLENSGIEADRINVIEAHGTGTQAGDPCEIESIRTAFGKQRQASNPLYVSSVKANMGHLEAASGVAGLAKLLLMLKHGSIPPQISLKNLNPRITNLERDNIIIPTSQTSWKPTHSYQNRLAVLNNFGASGSNAALILEEYSQNRAPDALAEIPLIFGLSAKTQKAAEALRDKYVTWLSKPEVDGLPLTDIAYTATARRQLYEYRLATSASSRADLILKLESAKVVRTEERETKTVFVFSGQGSQYLGMGSSLYTTSSLFKRHIDECHEILVSAGFSGILPIIVPGATGLNGTEEPGIEAYQAALFSIDYALARLWMSWGIKPAAVVGHSLGEYAAMVIAGVLSLHGALAIVAYRAKLMFGGCSQDKTGMIAVNLGSEKAEKLLGSSSHFSDLTIACYNSPTDCVISGPLEQLEEFKKHLDAHVQCRNILLSVPFGYHSSAMIPIVQDLTSFATTIQIRAPTIPIVSNVYGSIVIPGDKSVYNAQYFSKHCVEPVRFEDGINCLQSTFGNVDAWIEIGPHITTLPMLRSNPSLSPNALYLASLNKRHDPWLTLTSSLSTLYTSGFRISWRDTFSHIKSVSCVSLPTYAFAKSKFWVTYSEPKTEIPSVPSAEVQDSLEYTMLHTFRQRPCQENGYVAVFDTPISQLAPFITGHCVGGVPLCPASVYIEQVSAGLEMTMRHLGMDSVALQTTLREIDFSKPLVYHESIHRTVITTIKFGESSGSFTISSRVGTSAESIHCKGQYRLQPRSRTQSKFDRLLPVVERRMAAVLRSQSGKSPEMFSTRTIYDVIFPRVVKYSKEYQTMKSLCVTSDATEGCAKVSLPPDHNHGVYSTQPIFMDTLLHAAGFIANMQGGANDAYICSEVGAVKSFPELIKQDASYAVYCSNTWLPEQNVIICDAYAVALDPSKKIVASLKGMQFRRTRLRSLIGVLNAEAGVNNPRQPAMTKPLDLSLVTDKLRASRLGNEGKPSSVLLSVIATVSEACDINRSEVRADSDLVSLGVDSLMSIEITRKIRDLFPGTNLDTTILSHCQTIQQVVDEIQARIPNTETQYSTTRSTTPPSSDPSSPRTSDYEERDSQLFPSIVEELNVKAIISSVLDVSIHEVGDDQELEFLGLDSLTSIEALHLLKEKSSLDLPSDLFLSCKTPRSLQAFFTNQLRVDTKRVEVSPPRTAPTLLRSETIPSLLQEPNTPSDRTPLFLIHDGSGLTNYYKRLPSLDRAVWVFNNPHFETSEPWESVTQMARDYADRLQRLGQRQLILGGWSFGGVVAYETCVQLQSRGIDVKGIILIDTPEPFDHVPLSDSLINTVVNLDGPESSAKRLIKAQFMMNSRLLASYQPSSMGTSCPPMIYLRSKDGFRHPRIPDIPTWLSDRKEPESVTRGWNRLSNSNLTIYDIPGDHFSPFSSTNITQVSHRIQQSLQSIDRSRIL